MSAVTENLSRACRSLKSVRLRLLRPSLEGLDACTTDLETAVDCLKQLEADPSRPSAQETAFQPVYRSGLTDLRRELVQVNGLLASAGRFYQCWARLVPGAAAEAPLSYAISGKPSAAAPASKLVIHG